jgi:tetratricopeptide (TPR) repeat protein
MPTARYTVLFEREDGGRNKLCRLMLSGDGSYFVTVPYHPSEKVFLAKRRVNYANPGRADVSEPLEVALLEDDEHRLKLSHHPDGFVQFSGHGIVSGRDESGDPKGIGLKSFPLSRPTAGPAFGLTVMNPNAFANAGPPQKGDVVFRERDLYLGSTDRGLIVEFYYFAGMWRRFIYRDVDGPVLLLRHPSGALLKLRACMSPGPAWSTGFVGIDAWAAPIKLGDGDSGFAMHSPTHIHGYNEHGELEADAIYASYPPLSEDLSNAVPLTFPTRDDPPYREGGPSPSSEPLAPATRDELAQSAQRDVEQTASRGNAQRMWAIAGLANAKTLRDSGQPAASRLLLEQVVAISDSKYTPVAQYQLGNICRELRDIDAARAAFEAASRSDNPEVGPQATYNLAHLLEHLDPNAAKGAYARAMSLKRHEISPKAAVNLGILLFDHNDYAGARSAFGSAIRSEHPIQRPKALVNLAQIHVLDDDLPTAHEMLDEAISADHPSSAPQALLIKGDLEYASDRLDEAVQLFRRAVASRHPIFAPHAAMRLGRIHETAGEIEAARAAYESAAQLGGTETRVSAQSALYELRTPADDSESP